MVGQLRTYLGSSDGQAVHLFLRMFLSRGLLFVVVGLVVSYPSWTFF